MTQLLRCRLSINPVASCRRSALVLFGALALALTPGPASAAQLVWDPAQNGSGTAGSGTWNTTTGNTVWFNGTSDVLWSGTGTGNTPANGATFNGPDAAAGTYVVTLDSVEPGVNSLIINANGYTFTGPNPIYLASSDSLSVAANKTVTFNCNLAGSGTSPFWVLGSGATMNVGGNLASGQQLRLAGPADSAFNFTGANNTPAQIYVLGPVNVTAGALTTSSAVYIGYPNPGTIGGTSYSAGTLTVSGGSTVLTPNGNFLMIGRSGGQGTLVLNGGTVNAGNTTAAPKNLAICYDGNSTETGTVNVNSGTLNVGSSSVNAALAFFQTGEAAGETGTLNQTGGTINAWGGIVFGVTSGSGGTARLTQTGGALYVGQAGIAFGQGSPTTSITLSGGLVGALANWSSALPMTLGTTNGSITFQCADSSGIAHNISLSGALTGAGGLYVTGGGTLTLSGANNYTGSTLISNGTLAVVTGPIPSTNGPVTLDGSTGSAAVAIAVSNPGQYWVHNGTFSFVNALAGVPTASFQFGPLSPSTTVAPLLVNGNVACTATPNVNVSGTAIAVGTYPLIKYTGALTGLLPTSVTTWAGGTASAGYLTNLTATKTIALVVTSSSYNPALYWRGGSGVWDINTTANWTQFGGAVNYTDGSAVIFDDSASGTSPITVTLNTTVNPLSITANNGAKAYTITGTGNIAGSGALQVLGSGALTLNTTNTYNGGTVVNAGQLNINNGGDPAAGSPVGTGPLTLNAGAALDNTSGADVTLLANVPETWNGNFTYLGSGNLNTGPGQVTLTSSLTISNAAGNFTLGGTVADYGNNYQLSKMGNGTLTLAAPNVFSGGLSLYAGQLNFTDPSGLGNGRFAIYGGAIDNTSGSALVLNSPLGGYSWAGSFSFVGTASLDLSYGQVSIPNGLGSITVNVISNTLSTEGDIVNNNTRVVKIGNGTWEISGTAAGAQSLGLLVSAGQVNLHKTGGQAIQGGNNVGLTVQAGALVLDENNFQIHSDGAVPLPVVLAGGTWDLNGWNENVDQLTLTSGATLRNGAPSTTSNLRTISGYTALLNGDNCRFEVTAADAVLNFNGALGGSGSLVKLGAGVLNLNSNNTYTGNTTVSNGTLVLSYPSLASASSVSIATNAVLQLNFTATNVIGALLLNGVSQPTGLYNAATTPAYLAGSGSLQVTPSIPSTPTNLTYSLSANNFLLSWPSNYVGWILQTNAVGLQVSSAWHDVPGSATNTQLALPLTNPAVTNEFFRLRYPGP